ncbi:hypothetical protein ACTGVI_12750, partial [Streptococcus suis]
RACRHSSKQAPDWLTRREFTPKFKFFNSGVRREFASKTKCTKSTIRAKRSIRVFRAALNASSAPQDLQTRVNASLH